VEGGNATAATKEKSRCQDGTGWSGDRNHWACEEDSAVGFHHENYQDTTGELHRCKAGSLAVPSSHAKPLIPGEGTGKDQLIFKKPTGLEELPEP
jgi:hypothetical protein